MLKFSGSSVDEAVADPDAFRVLQQPSYKSLGLVDGTLCSHIGLPGTSSYLVPELPANWLIELCGFTLLDYPKKQW